MRLSDIVKQQAHLRNRLAICNAVINYLHTQFITTKNKEATHQILNEEGLAVGEKDIQDFCQYLSDTVASKDRVELDKLSELDIVQELIERIRENPDLIPIASLKAKSKAAKK